MAAAAVYAEVTTTVGAWAVVLSPPVGTTILALPEEGCAGAVTAPGYTFALEPQTRILHPGYDIDQGISSDAGRVVRRARPRPSMTGQIGFAVGVDPGGVEAGDECPAERVEPRLDPQLGSVVAELIAEGMAA